MEMFEKAARLKLRFNTVRGLVSVEALYDMPLTSRNGFDLDSVARIINSNIKGMGEESFVSTTANTPAKIEEELKLEIVKHIIAVDLKAAEDAKARKTRVEKRQKLMELLAKKQDAALEGLSADEIMTELNALDDPA